MKKLGSETSGKIQVFFIDEKMIETENKEKNKKSGFLNSLYFDIQIRNIDSFHVDKKSWNH